jgi:hypothetical protein
MPSRVVFVGDEDERRKTGLVGRPAAAAGDLPPVGLSALF